MREYALCNHNQLLSKQFVIHHNSQPVLVDIADYLMDVLPRTCAESDEDDFEDDECC